MNECNDKDDKMKILSELLEFCETEEQTDRITALINHGTSRLAGEFLGVSKTTINNTVNTVKKIASRRGLNPDYDQPHTLPRGQVIKGVSTLYDKNGDVAMQWVKSKTDDTLMLEVMAEVVSEISKEIKPIKEFPKVESFNSELMNVVVITDYHIGMLAWEGEGGRNWDLNISEDVLKASVYDLISRSPDAQEGMLCFLGDTLHYDSLDSVTTMSGNVLDSDSRYRKMIQFSISMIKESIELMLSKHEKVKLLIAEGNHDLIGAQWLQELFKALYSYTDRVEVICSARPYYCIVHGKTMISAHHGHLKKMSKLTTTIPAMFPKEWGNTEYRYCLTGHIHHSSKIEDGGLITESFQTLVAPDSYATRHGFISNNSAVSITYHKEYGEYSRITTRPIK